MRGSSNKAIKLTSVLAEAVGLQVVATWGSASGRQDPALTAFPRCSTAIVRIGAVEGLSAHYCHGGFPIVTFRKISSAVLAVF